MASSSSHFDSIERAIDRIAGLFAVAGGLALFMLMAVTVVSVFWRYALRDPISGIEDLSVTSLAVVVAAGVGYGAVHGAHISVNVISSFFGRKATRITDAISRLAGLAICLYATWGLIKKGGCGLPCGAITQNLSILHTPFYYALAAAMGLYAAVLLHRLVVGFANWSGEDPYEEKD